MYFQVMKKLQHQWNLGTCLHCQRDIMMHVSTPTLVNYTLQSFRRRSLKKAIYLVTLIVFSIAFLCILSDVFAVLACLDKSLVHGRLYICVVFYGVNNLKLFLLRNFSGGFSRDSPSLPFTLHSKYPGFLHHLEILTCLANPMVAAWNTVPKCWITDKHFKYQFVSH